MEDLTSKFITTQEALRAASNLNMIGADEDATIIPEGLTNKSLTTLEQMRLESNLNQINYARDVMGSGLWFKVMIPLFIGYFIAAGVVALFS